MKTQRAVNLFAGAALLASTLAIPSPAQTQAQAQQMYRFTTTHVKPDMVTEWIDLQKNEVIPALKKGGVKTRNVYRSGLFGNSYEFTIIQPFQSFAEFDGQSPMVKGLDEAGARRLGDKLRKCIVSQSSYVGIRMTDLTNLIEGDTPTLIVSTRYRIALGKMTDFQNIMKSDVVPVYKKNKVGVITTRRTLGANPSDVTVSVLYKKYADLDGGPMFTKLAGQDAVTKINAKFVGVRTPIDVVVRSRVADLSF